MKLLSIKDGGFWPSHNGKFYFYWPLTRLILLSMATFDHLVIDQLRQQHGKTVLWASLCDYGTNHIGGQRWLRRACASMQCRPEPSLFAHIKHGSTWRVQPKIRHLAPLDGCTCTLKNEFRENEKCHNLMRRLIISCLSFRLYDIKYTWSLKT